MRSVARWLGGLALAVLCGALLARLVVDWPASVADFFFGVRNYWFTQVHRPLVLGAAVGAVAAWGAAFGLAWRARQLAAGAMALQSAGGISAGAERILADLAPRLRQMLHGSVDAIGFVECLLEGAIRAGVSDVHIEPETGCTRILFRLHGVLEPVVQVSPQLHRRIINRLKVVAQLVSFTIDRPQDGHFVVPGVTAGADVRVSLLPTNHGEKAVLRIARAVASLPDLQRLGLSESTRVRLLRVLDSPQGLIYVTGPTGSGKTTTIYAALGHIKKSRGQTTQIATIEDPIEFDLPQFTQTQVHPDVGLTFASGLRSILRQDPNVLMVGEIRDAETARIAVQAGLTGHLILTTVHADSAAGVFNRLIEMDVEAFLVASASLISVSQRLIRTLCPSCRRETQPTDEQSQHLARYGLEVHGPVYLPGGCERCEGQGFVGRRPLLEVLEVTPAIRDLIAQKVPTSHIHAAALQEGMLPLVSDGLSRAEEGLTTLDEALRIVL